MQDLKWALSHSESMPTRTKCGGGHARDQHERRTTTRAIRPAHSDKRVTRAISKWRPRHNESYPARTKWQEDSRTISRWIPGHNETQKVDARNVGHHSSNTICNSGICCKYLACHQKMKHRHPKSCTFVPATHNDCNMAKWKMTSVSPSERIGPGKKTSSKFTTLRLSSKKNRQPAGPLILTHACQHFSNVHEVLRLSRGWKSVRSVVPATQNKVLTLQKRRISYARREKCT